ncbi:hypothetical protein EAH78_26920 [Pseudomonas arsenicoxydans]|uniref:Uncharacterized protein n=1 Tax=Pseudomonas arsenicoxydans TaxID=702115 RepID=A0A502HG14_9PSED|nr:hypothetical protein EAH78_26920 [Pseudomonas arsenicoxydans]
MCMRSPVGAGLLAKAVGQSTSLLDVKPSSRASPLPQWERSAVNQATKSPSVRRCRPAPGLRIR